jgi:hypothetical protein
MNPYEPVASVERETVSAETAIVSEPVYRPLSWLARMAFVFAGILVPIGSHMLSLGGLPDAPDWQTGELGDKLSFILTSQAGFVFYPALAYAMTCLTLYLIYDHKERVAFWVRLGIYGGVPVALWYSLVLDIRVIDTPTDITLVMLQFGIPLGIYCLLWGLKWLHRKTIVPVGWYVLAAILVGGTLVACVMDFESTMEAIIGGPLFGSLLCGPVWAFLVYTSASLRLLRDPRASIPPGDLEKLSGLLYFGYVFASCPVSVLFSLNKYSSLPTQPVASCYVVTAAARGHRRFVGSKIELINGIERPVNSQLLRLREFEQLLKDSLPNGHRRLRRVYDRIGPQLAAWLANPWLADLAYVSLKPVEWAAILLLWTSSLFSKAHTPNATCSIEALHSQQS